MFLKEKINANQGLIQTIKAIQVDIIPLVSGSIL